MTKSTLFANMYKNLSMENNKSVPYNVQANATGKRTKNGEW